MKARYSALLVLVVTSWIGQGQSWGGGVSTVLAPVVYAYSAAFFPAVLPLLCLSAHTPIAADAWASAGSILLDDADGRLPEACV